MDLDLVGNLALDLALVWIILEMFVLLWFLGLGLVSPSPAFATMVTTFGLSGIVGKSLKFVLYPQILSDF